MFEKYDIENEGEILSLVHRKTQLKLWLFEEKRGMGRGEVSFSQPYPEEAISYVIDRIEITARDLRDYHRLPKFNPTWQYLEVGAGLGEFSPSLVGRVGKKPIVIDPANYHLLAEMLDDSLQLGSRKVIRDRIGVLLSRCETILNSEKIILYNKTLGQVIREHPELNGIADVVVDNYGPRCYCGTETLPGETRSQKHYALLCSRVYELKQRLLNKGVKD